MDDITSAVVESVPNTPVTVKMRMGWNLDSIIIPEAGYRLEKIGVKAITLHARTTKQRYTGNADWEYIRILKNSVNIPVIGNGDIRNTEDMMSMFEKTSCDAVMVARAAQGNPWFFERAKAHLNGTTPPPYPSLKEIAKICNRHFDLLLQSRGESAGTNLMRKHFSNYIKGFPGASEFRKKLITAPNLKAMKNALNQFKLSSY
tara:strand:- start:679 stop:1287 length:609 start_codon:yes stop_codon:yes gene_type:complete